MGVLLRDSLSGYRLRATVCSVLFACTLMLVHSVPVLQVMFAIFPAPTQDAPAPPSTRIEVVFDPADLEGGGHSGAGGRGRGRGGNDGGRGGRGRGGGRGGRGGRGGGGGWAGGENRFLRFVLYKENMDTQVGEETGWGWGRQRCQLPTSVAAPNGTTAAVGDTGSQASKQECRERNG